MDFDTYFFFKYIYYPGSVKSSQSMATLIRPFSTLRRGISLSQERNDSVFTVPEPCQQIYKGTPRNIPNCFRNTHFYHRQRDLMENQSVKHIFHNTSHKHIKCLLSIFSNIREEVEKTHLLFKEYFRVITVGHKYMALDPYFKRR